MKRRFVCLALALGLCVGGALAAEERFPAAAAYPGFPDVAESAWYYDSVKLCCELGLMNGVGDGFQPEESLTVAQCATVAARLRERLTGQAVSLSGPSQPWYGPYLAYMLRADAALAPLLDRPEEPCTRMEYLSLLGAAIPRELGLLEAVNHISSLPDCDSALVLEFYNAGILTGLDETGAFAPERFLTRAECAAMLCRVARPQLRVRFSLPEEAGGVMTVNGQPVSREVFVQILNDLVYQQDLALSQQTGAGLDWDGDYGVGDLADYFRNAAIQQCLRYVILNEKAASLGCSADDLPAKLFPDPGYDALSAYAAQRDLLRAKHILVNDLDSANAVLDGLKAVPTLEQFNALLAVFGTDPGMDAQPDGYLFTAGEMVEEFESAVRAMPVDSFSPEPVRSPYGYHIIWRLDPALDPQLPRLYQYDKALEQLDLWAGEAQLTVDSGQIESIDPRACYETFLNQ